MSTKDLRLDLEATLTEALFGHGHAHYGYWPKGASDTPSLAELAASQQAYFEHLAHQIPDGVRTILDVGSGTGANALGLTALGYAVECLCPSEHLNRLAREKLPHDVNVHTTTFEAFDSPQSFDLCLFAESFHYIDQEQALAQIARYADRYVLIFDYFRRAPGESLADRQSHSSFLSAVAQQNLFAIERDDDLTEAILPTFAALDHLKTAYVGPFVQRARQAFSESHPLRMRLADLIIGRKLDQIGRADRRADRFAEQFEYRLILMSRKSARGSDG